MKVYQRQRISGKLDIWRCSVRTVNLEHPEPSVHKSL
jgi:hypothetical protein